MFKPVRYDEGRLTTKKLADSQTVVKGDTLKWSSGYLAVCGTGSYQDARFVAMESITSTTDKPDIVVIPTDEDIEFEADCSHVVSIVDRGTYADFATKATIDPDASTYNDFYIKEIVGAAETATKVLGHFTRTIA
jgi:hypothetical protein